MARSDLEQGLRHIARAGVTHADAAANLTKLPDLTAIEAELILRAVDTTSPWWALRLALHDCWCDILKALRFHLHDCAECGRKIASGNRCIRCAYILKGFYEGLD